jgi:hypothetical protein
MPTQRQRQKKNRIVKQPTADDSEFAVFLSGMRQRGQPARPKPVSLSTAKPTKPVTLPIADAIKPVMLPIAKPAQPVTLPIADANNTAAGEIISQKHTPQMQNTIIEYTNAVDKNLVDFARQVNQSLNKGENVNGMNYVLAEAKPREIADIKEAIGVDTTGFIHNIKGNAVVHIGRRHGKNGQQDNSMKDINDIGRIQYVLDHYDSVERLIGKKGIPEKSGDIRNADHTRADMVLYKKRIDGIFYLVEAVPDNARKQIQVVTAYIQLNKTK